MARFAGVLKTLGVDKGDRVITYMPLTPQAAIAMMAVAHLLNIRFGKILRKLLQQITAGSRYTILFTIDDPSGLSETA